MDPAVFLFLFLLPPEPQPPQSPAPGISTTQPRLPNCALQGIYLGLGLCSTWKVPIYNSPMMLTPNENFLSIDFAYSILWLVSWFLGLTFLCCYLKGSKSCFSGKGCLYIEICVDNNCFVLTLVNKTHSSNCFIEKLFSFHPLYFQMWKMLILHLRSHNWL